MSFFSIIIPLYNKERHIHATMESALMQSFQNFEIIVVNDGSTDGSLAVVESFKDARIKIFNQKNQGVSCARNYGVEKASSNLIVFLDADDLWTPHHLERLKTLFGAFPGCGLYAMAYLKQTKKITMPSVYNTIPTTTDWMGIVDKYFESCYIDSIAWTSAVMIPKAILQQHGGFNNALEIGEDIDLWIRIALNHKVAFSNQVTAIHNLHADNRASNAPVNSKSVIDLDVFEDDALSNPSLRKYLDLNRFSLAIQYKRVGNLKKANDLIRKIDLNHLNRKQRTLLTLKPTALRLAFKLKGRLQDSGIVLSSFR